jgi:anti-sigma factor RsiW
VTHSDIRAHLSDYLEGDLSGRERSRIDAHLEDCTDCDRELNELRATVSLLRRLPEPPLPPGIGSAVMTRIALGEGREARVLPLFRRAAEPRFAAPLAAGLAGLFFLFQSGDAGLSPQPSRAVAPGTLARVALDDAAMAFPVERGGFEDAWLNARDSGLGSQAGVTSGFTPAAAYEQYRTQARREESERRMRIQEFARQLRGAGHPHSATLASDFEARPNVVLAGWQPR